MLFNSIDFAIFLPIVFALFWLAGKKGLVYQNLVIVISSFIFYGWWDWKFLSLLLLSSGMDFTLGLFINQQKTDQRRKYMLYLSLLLNLGMLVFFKYYNFFIENFIEAFKFFGHSIQPNTLNIILPVGISFYTFQTLSYTIDVYRKELEPTKDPIAFFAFVGFFPQLVAGPIERATNLLPQFYTQRVFNYDHAKDGLRQMLWGLFKKIVIADNCAEYANMIFNNYEDHTGGVLALGALLFTIQIYCDFSGYSDIAIGTAKLFGFHLMRNFAFPYFSRDIAEFWRRWHISLSTWFRDYIYIPLGGSKVSTFKKVRNTFIIFIVSGFWHGANWTFIFWGLLNAVYFLPLLLLQKNRTNLGIIAEHSIFPTPREFVGMAVTFCLTVFAWIFFRAENLNHAWGFISGIFSSFSQKHVLSDIYVFVFGKMGIVLTVLVTLFFVAEWFGRRGQFALENIKNSVSNVMVRWMIYYTIAITIFLFAGREQQFIYFQF